MNTGTLAENERACHKNLVLLKNWHTMVKTTDEFEKRNLEELLLCQTPHMLRQKCPPLWCVCVCACVSERSSVRESARARARTHENEQE